MDLQEYIFKWADGKVNFAELEDKVTTMAFNRASMGMLALVEVDKVTANPCDDDQEAACWPYCPGEEVEIDYVG